MREPTLCWEHDSLRAIDQSLLPRKKEYLILKSAEAVYDAIRRLKIRGAPAIGIAGAFGLYLGVRDSQATDAAAFRSEVAEVAAYLKSARPTGVNLAWALDRVCRRLDEHPGESVDELKALLLQEAQALVDEDHAVCRAIGEHGLQLLRPGMGILTHCNAGGLGTARYGTALAPIYLAAEQGMPLHVYADETRPVLQGARLTAWELHEAGIPVTVICDNMAAVVMARGDVQAVIVGTDRVARNGDVANKIGTYGLAVLAKAHGIPFYVAAPRSSIDLSIEDGSRIPIENRDPREVSEWGGVPVTPEGVEIFNPAFDVTPAEYVTAFITEVGLLYPPFPESLADAMRRPGPAPHRVAPLPDEARRRS